MKSRQVDQIPPHPSHLVSNSPPQQQPLMSNSRPPGHVNESNARGMPGVWMLMSLFDRYITKSGSESWTGVENYAGKFGTFFL